MHEHEFVRYEKRWSESDFKGWLAWNPVWYVGYACACGEQGYAVPA